MKKIFKKENLGSIIWSLVGLLALTLVITGIVYTVNLAGIQGKYYGVEMTDVQKQAQATALKVANWKDLPDGANNWFPDGKYGWAGIPAGWYALMACTVIVAISSMIFLAGWLKGAKWLNKSNPYIKGQVYVRTRLQNVVFRVSAILIAAILIWSFLTEALWSDILGFTDGRKFLTELWNYITGPGAWYFQCFLSSLFIGIALLFKKYHWMPVLMPLALIGAIRTFADLTGDWGEDAAWDSLYFHRFVIVHIMIVVGPLFIMIAQRQSYSLLNIKRTLIYTFLMAFGAYMMYVLAAWGNKGTYALQSAGEIKGVGSWWGFSDVWMNKHVTLLFWGMLVPFGFGVTTVVIFIYEFFNKKSVAEGNWARRWVTVWKEYANNVKAAQWIEFKKSFARFTYFFFHQEKHVRAKNNYVSFGIKPKKGQVSRDSYTWTK